MAKAAVKDSKEKSDEKNDVEVVEGHPAAKSKPWLLIAVIVLSSILVLAGAIGGTVYVMSRGTHKVPDAAAQADAGVEGFGERGRDRDVRGGGAERGAEQQESGDLQQPDRRPRQVGRPSLVGQTRHRAPPRRPGGHSVRRPAQDALAAVATH